MRARHFLQAIWLLLVLSPISSADAQLESEAPEGWSVGPTTTALGAVALIDVPEGYVAADEDTTRLMMEQMGNRPTGQEVGLVMPTDDDATWFVVFEYFPVGYVADDDQDQIDADALLDSISEGTEQANAYRSGRGIPAIHVTGWYEAPHYDPESHNLVWALQAEDEEGGKVVNHNVRLLGRGGYMSATLVTDVSRMAADKLEAESVLAGFSYSPGHKYAEFRNGDKLAGYGLTALVAGGAGVAAAKLGLFSKLGKLLAGMWKIILLGLAALGASLKRLFGGRSVSSDSDVEPA